MKLSAPIYQLKRQARALRQSQDISLAQALDLIARREGFSSWSLLQARRGALLPRSYDKLLGYFQGGDLVLIAGRPTHGKTSFTLGLVAQAARERGVACGYFSLDFVRQQALERIALYDEGWQRRAALYHLDFSDQICADYVMEHSRAWVTEGSVVAVDYLQLLDLRRSTPPLQEQVEALKDWARRHRCVLLCISQVSRAVEARLDKRPGLEDIHLPNPLELSLFHKKVLLYKDAPGDAKVEVTLARAQPHRFYSEWRQGRFW